MRTTLSIVSTDVSTGKASSKSYGNIIGGYVGLIGGQAPALPYIVNEPGGSAQARVTSFAAWTDSVARGINALSSDTYSDATITFSASINEETAGD